MLKQLEFIRMQRQADVVRKLKHFRFTVREQLRMLTHQEFIELCETVLHRNHFPLLQELMIKLHNLQEVEYKQNKREFRRLLYLVNSHRKTLTQVLTSLEPDGYSSNLVEYLIVNNLWRI